jgi:hypothetical protein
LWVNQFLLKGELREEIGFRFSIREFLEVQGGYTHL